MLPEIKRILEPGELVSANLDFQPTADGFLADMHQAFELGVVIDGAVERRFPDFATTLRPGDVWLVPAWEPHAYRWFAPSNFRFLICFAPEFLGEEAFDGASWLSLFAAAPANRPWVRSEVTREQARALAQELGRECQEAAAGWHSAVRQGVLKLLLLLYRAWAPPSPTSLRVCNTNNLARVTPALDLVQTNPERRVGLAEAATACSLSQTQFRFLFRETMGATFGAFSLRARLNHAARLLLHTDLPLKAISERTGFTDHSHLHRAFTKAYGCTPGRYRERHEGMQVVGSILDN